MENFTINITNKCNAVCRHCCFSCTPNSKTELSEEEVLKLVNYASNHETIEEVSLTGGEIFLRKELVYKCIEIVKNSNKRITCITNGFWGKKLDVAKDISSKLLELKLDSLRISYDDFHQEFIDAGAIKNIIDCFRNKPINLSISSVVTKKEKGLKFLKDLEDDLHDIPISRHPCIPVGRSMNLDYESFYNKIDSKEEMKCPDPSIGMVVHNDKIVYPCCSPVIFKTILNIGNINDNTIEELEESYLSNSIIYIVKKEGPSWFKEKAIKKGLFKPRDKYISPCELCSEIFENYSIINGLEDEIKDYINNI